jgi:type II secretory pathway component PulL
VPKAAADAFTSAERALSNISRPRLILTAAANTFDLLIQREVCRIAELIRRGPSRVWLVHRWRILMIVVSLALRLRRLSNTESCDEDDEHDALQQFLQIFPTVLSTLLFS